MSNLHRSHDVEDNALCNLGPRSSQIFLVNVFPPKLKQLKNLQVHRSYDVKDNGQRFVFVLDGQGQRRNNVLSCKCISS